MNKVLIYIRDTIQNYFIQNAISTFCDELRLRQLSKKTKLYYLAANDGLWVTACIIEDDEDSENAIILSAAKVNSVYYPDMGINMELQFYKSILGKYEDMSFYGEEIKSDRWK